MLRYCKEVENKWKPAKEKNTKLRQERTKRPPSCRANDPDHPEGEKEGMVHWGNITEIAFTALSMLCETVGTQVRIL